MDKPKDASALFRFRYLGPKFDELKAKHPYLAQDQLFFDTLSIIVLHRMEYFKEIPVDGDQMMDEELPLVELYLQKTPQHQPVLDSIYCYRSEMGRRLIKSPDDLVQKAFDEGLRFLWVCAHRIVFWERCMPRIQMQTIPD